MSSQFLLLWNLTLPVSIPVELSKIFIFTFCSSVIVNFEHVIADWGPYKI